MIMIICLSQAGLHRYNPWGWSLYYVLITSQSTSVLTSSHPKCHMQQDICKAANGWHPLSLPASRHPTRATRV